MLRITTDLGAQVLTLRLEGRLEGPWVEVLAQSWRRALPRLRGRRLCIDLKGVTFVDVQGKARLAEIHARGAELLADDLETRAMVEEIRTTRAGAADAEPRRPASGQEGAANMSDQLTPLERLEIELHEVNQELSHAARPLARLDELNEEQRRDLAARLRTGLSRWESVAQRISRALGTENPKNK